MPRQQTARSSARAVDNDAKRPQQKYTKQLLSEVLGGDPEFADKFFGESPNMNRAVRAANDADGDISVDVNGVQDGTGDVGESNSKPANTGSGQHRIPRNVGKSAITIENTHHDIDHLIICQLHEDLDSYRYDVDFCKTQLEPDNMDRITPAEARTFQLRLLDLGHQMRSIHHRIQVMQATCNNSMLAAAYNGRAGANTANAYYGPYPPGTSLQPNGLYPPTTGPSTPYDRQGRPLQPSAAYNAAYYDTPQDRRGPGRPLGSRNRTRPTPDAPQAPGSSGSAKAAALASAGAKRTLTSEIMVASLDGNAPTDGVPGSSEKPAKLSKRPRVDSGVGSPRSNNAEDHYDDAPTPPAGVVQTEIRDSDDSGLLSEASETLAPSGEAIRNTMSSGGLVELKAGGPSTPVLVPPLAHAFTSTNRPPSGDPAYTRLGRWMCTLCTSQKYLKHPAPKQPAEPSSWALRDISKMVTHFTRMHTEHTDPERLQELGNALETNFGQFTYWVRVTKKTTVSDEEVQQAVAELHEGRLPNLLGRLSTAAAQFPGRK